MKKLIIIFAFLIFGCSANNDISAQKSDEIFTIYLVRHSEKDLAFENQSDPPLSECGEKRSKHLKNSRILVLGLSYKKNIDDCRESPSIKIINYLIKSGAEVSYNDPYIPSFTFCSDYKIKLKSSEINVNNIKSQDCIILITDHDIYEYKLISKHSKLIVDTRGRFSKSENIIKA